MKAIEKTFETGGQSITIETGKLAKQADGAFTVEDKGAFRFVPMLQDKAS